MSEPYDPQPPAQDAPGPDAELWTLNLRNPRTGAMRKVPVFARSRAEAQAQLYFERQDGEMLIRVDQGGTLPPVRR